MRIRRNKTAVVARAWLSAMLAIQVLWLSKTTSGEERVGLRGALRAPVRTFEVRASALKEALVLACSTVQSSETSLTQLNGIFWDLRSHRMDMFGTDGRRIVQVSQLIVGPQDAGVFFMPIGEARKLHDQLPLTGTLTLEIEEHHARLSGVNFAAHVRLEDTDSTSLVDDMKKVIRQTQPETMMSLDRAVWLASMRALSTAGQPDAFGAVRTVFSATSHGITCRLRHLGGTDERIATNYAGRELEAVYDLRYLISMLEALPVDEHAAQFGFAPPLSALVVRTPSLVYLVLPMADPPKQADISGPR